MGRVKPYYGAEDINNEILKIDEEMNKHLIAINELAIKREVYVKKLKKEIKAPNNPENKD